MKAIKFLRNGATIREIDDNNGHTDTTYYAPDKKTPSINAAKRKSRTLQNCAGGCGDQSLRVVTKFKG